MFFKFLRAKIILFSLFLIARTFIKSLFKINPLTMTKRLPPRMYASRISGTISANPRLVPTPRKSELSIPKCRRNPSLPNLASKTMVIRTA